MRTESLAYAAAHLSEIVDEVVSTHEWVTVTRDGRPVVVILSVEDFESLEATLELLADPEIQARIAAGDTDPLDQIPTEFGNGRRAPE